MWQIDRIEYDGELIENQILDSSQTNFKMYANFCNDNLYFHTELNEVTISYNCMYTIQMNYQLQNEQITFVNASELTQVFEGEFKIIRKHGYLYLTNSNTTIYAY